MEINLLEFLKMINSMEKGKLVDNKGNIIQEGIFKDGFLILPKKKKKTLKLIIKVKKYMIIKN